MKPLLSRCALAALALAGALVGCSGGNDAPSGPAIPTKVGHVFIIVLENEGYDSTFNTNKAQAPYLSTTLPSMGALLTQYYATSHHSLSNYITMISGQTPTVATQADCPTYLDFTPPNATPDDDGQVTGSGCVYPAAVKTLANQLHDAGLTWKGYMEDMGKDTMRDGGATCAHPMLGFPDQTYSSAADDMYATKHNPFVYFHAIIDDPAMDCAGNDVPLTQLDTDLASVATTPNYAFITPNQCNDGHDPDPTTNPNGTMCADMSTTTGLAAMDNFLKLWVPKILNSPAFKQDGLLIVTFDEAESADVSFCCGEDGISHPNTPSMGAEHNGSGGGLIGAVLLSPLIKPGTVSNTPYNHYSMLRSMQAIFDLSPPLGHANSAPPFGLDVFTNVNP